jgi:hypothetical protein
MWDPEGKFPLEDAVLLELETDGEPADRVVRRLILSTLAKQ